MQKYLLAIMLGMSALPLFSQTLPEMIEVKAGEFQMGCVEGDLTCGEFEKPVHKVSIPAFKLAATETTFDQWQACVDAGGCSHQPDDAGFGRGNRPLINVSWVDVQEYIAWLNSSLDSNAPKYRLPTEAEWEYAAKAGTETVYYWGNEVGKGNANCADCGSENSANRTDEVASLMPNPWGFYDISGNVWEWLADCYNDSYEGAPNDGSAWLSGDCEKRRLKGGAYQHPSWAMRLSNRNYKEKDFRSPTYGFRLAQDI